MSYQQGAQNGRRPLLSTFVGNNRQMLEDIASNLSHVRLQPLPDGNGKLQIHKPELSQSTTNLAERVAGGKMTRLGYHQKALAEIRNSLAPFENTDLSHLQQTSSENNTEVDGHMLQQLLSMGYDVDVANLALKKSGGKSVEAAIEMIQQLAAHAQHIQAAQGKNGFAKSPVLPGYTKVIRKPSFEEKYRQGSPASTPDNVSVRSDSPSVNCSQFPRQHVDQSRIPNNHMTLGVPPNGHAYVCANGMWDTAPPPLPPRTGVPSPPGGGVIAPGVTYSGGTAPPSPQQGQHDVRTGPPGHVQQMIKRMSAGSLKQLDLRQGLSASQLGNGSVSGQKGPVTVGRQPVIVQNSVAQQNGGFHHLHGNMQTSSPGLSVKSSPPPPYAQALPSKPSPTIPHHGMQGMSNLHEQQSHLLVNNTRVHDYRLGTPGSQSSSGSSTPTSVGPGHAGTNTPSPTIPTPKPVPMQAWGAKQPPIIMQSVKSREVQKPVLQTATVPLSPPQQGHSAMTAPSNYISSVQAQVNMPPSHHHHPHMSHGSPLSNVQIEITRNFLGSNSTHANAHHFANPTHYGHVNVQPQASAHQNMHQTHPANLQNGSQARTIQIQVQHRQPVNQIQFQNVGDWELANHINQYGQGSTPRSDSPVSRATNQSPMSIISTTSTPSTNSDIPDRPPPPYPGKILHQPPLIVANKQPVSIVNNQDNSPDSYTSKKINGVQNPDQEETQEKTRCTSPIPERKPEAKKKDEERCETKVKIYSPEAYKFFMEQHLENVLKSHQQRINRRKQLESEMSQVGLSEEAQCQMRKMLHQKESNYIRLKRAKMDKYQFEVITILGVGAFGEVALTRKKDTHHLYAMKTLRKNDVLRRNQVAHVKAERDILAEADNEWVVKLYYSFQDKDNLYFVMDYIPGGDMMSLLIKFELFEEPLARFYIAELVLAIESVHKMGFIHRDIKPDNILIDKNGHIKLTDFGLCTGFRWTHNSKYYQKGNHMYQDSMDPGDNWDDDSHIDKPLERRKHQEHQRSLAHSLVGTPNYIAPEVLQRKGYSACCDWWSVGVILYEMLVGQPPFLAESPAMTQYKVINWKQNLHIPIQAGLSQPAENLITRLCCGPNERLGNNGASEIKEHPFFQSANFEGLRHQPSPYKPVIHYDTDTQNFDPIEPGRLRTSGSMDNQDKRDLHFQNGKHPEHAFFEFTFRRFFDDGGHPYPQQKPTVTNSDETNDAVYV